MAAATDPGTILMVADQLDGVQVLGNQLLASGFQLLLAPDSASALSYATERLPDLILLDGVMPGMAGLELCRQLKEAPDTATIPVIFLTSDDDVIDESEALKLGAVDFIDKQLPLARILARMNTHLTMRRLQHQLAAQVSELEVFAQMVAHDLKNPLSTIMGYTDLLLDDGFDTSPEVARQMVATIHETAAYAETLVDSLLLMARVRRQDVPRELIDMGALVHEALCRVEPLVRQHGASIQVIEPWPLVLGHGPWVEEVWVNYLTNALKYGGSPPRLVLGSTLVDAHTVCFWVQDNGLGIPPQSQHRLFMEFSKLHHSETGHGLGLSIVKRIVEKLGGEVGVESEVGVGSRFFFTLRTAEGRG